MVVSKSQRISTSGLSEGEWHKCRRYWRKGLECPFHRLGPEKGPRPRPTEETELPEPRKPRVRGPDIGDPEIVRFREPKGVDYEPDDPDDPDGDGEDVWRPLPPVEPDEFPPGVDLPPFERPGDPLQPVPDGGFEEDEGLHLPGGAPVLGGRVGRSTSEEISGDDVHDRNGRNRNPRGGDPLTPAFAVEYATSIIQLFNREFVTKGGLFLPPLPSGLHKRMSSGDVSSIVESGSIYQDALIDGENAYLRSLPTSQQGLLNQSMRRESVSPRQTTGDRSTGQIASAATIAAISGIGVRAFQQLTTPGRGRGGFITQGHIRSAELGFVR